MRPLSAGAKIAHVAHAAPNCHTQALSRVEVDGKIVKADAIASELLTGSSCRVELFDALAPPPTAEQIAASAPPPPAHAKTAPATAPAPAPAPTAATKPAPAAAPIPAGTPAASNTMPVCKYGLACRIISPKEECTSKHEIIGDNLMLGST